MLLLSLRYMAMPRPICLRLFMQRVWTALALALARAGRSIAARIAIMAMTTSSSIRVKPRTRRVRPGRRPKEECGRFFFIESGHRGRVANFEEKSNPYVCSGGAKVQDPKFKASTVGDGIA